MCLHIESGHPGKGQNMFYGSVYQESPSRKTSADICLDCSGPDRLPVPSFRLHLLTAYLTYAYPTPYLHPESTLVATYTQGCPALPHDKNINMLVACLRSGEEQGVVKIRKQGENRKINVQKVYLVMKRFVTSQRYKTKHKL